MAFSFASIVGGVDVLLTKVNSFIRKQVDYNNAIPGAALNIGSVTNDKLAKRKGFFQIEVAQDASLAGTSRINIFRKTFLNIDGAADSSFRITGWCFNCRDNGTSITKGAGNQLLIKVNGVTVITIDLNAAGLTLVTGVSQTALSAALVTAISVTSGQDVSVDYVYGGVAAVYPFPQLFLDCTVNHPGT